MRFEDLFVQVTVSVSPEIFARERRRGRQLRLFSVIIVDYGFDKHCNLYLRIDGYSPVSFGEGIHSIEYRRITGEIIHRVSDNNLKIKLIQKCTCLHVLNSAES